LGNCVNFSKLTTAIDLSQLILKPERFAGLAFFEEFCRGGVLTREPSQMFREIGEIVDQSSQCTALSLVHPRLDPLPTTQPRATPTDVAAGIAEVYRLMRTIPSSERHQNSTAVSVRKTESDGWLRATCPQAEQAWPRSGTDFPDGPSSS
jgi:hypothetical protein